MGFSLVLSKIQNSIETLKCLPLDHVENAIHKQQEYLRQLRRASLKSIQALLGIEGGSAQFYFNSWKGLPLRWKGTSRKPIPNDWLKFSTRTSVQSTKPQNRNASHPVNAMLNYAYAILKSRVRSEIVAHGYDPIIGYLHSYDKDRAALVFDLMEPLRPVADRVVLDLVRNQKFEPADFTIRQDGVCRLNPELAKRIVTNQTASIDSQALVPPRFAFTAKATRRPLKHCSECRARARRVVLRAI